MHMMCGAFLRSHAQKTCSPLKRDLSVRSPFDVGLLTKPDWAGAVWVASQATPRLTTCQMYEVHPAPYFRRTFSITQKVRSC